MDIVNLFKSQPKHMKQHQKVTKVFDQLKQRQDLQGFDSDEEAKSVKLCLSCVWSDWLSLSKKHVADSEVILNWAKELVFSLNSIVERIESPRPRGRPKGTNKRLCEDMCQKTCNKILNNLLLDIEKQSQAQSVGRVELLNLLIEKAQASWKDDDEIVVKKKRSLSKDILKDDACALMLNLNLSVNQYELLRLYLSPHGISIPTKNEVSEYKKTLLPDDSLIKKENTKTSIPLKTAVANTVEAILNNTLEQSANIKEVEVTGKVGADGSGAHQVRHQIAEGVTNDDSSKNYLGAFWTPLTIKVDGEFSFENKFRNSLFMSRPVFLTREKENRESIKEHFKPVINEANELETSQQIQIKLHGSITTIKLKVHTEVSMIDGKMADLIQGDSGSPCHYCKATTAQINDVSTILQGFTIEKTVEEMKSTFNAVQTGELHYDDPQRAGQCHEPLNFQNLKFFAILHSKLRSLDHCQKLYYYLVAGQTHSWTLNANAKRAVDAAKKEAVQHIRQTCGFLMDMPTANGGNTNTGTLAQKFFAPQYRQRICSLINNSRDRENFAQLLQYFNKIITVTQSVDVSKSINAEKLEYLGKDLMLHHKRCFSFAMIPPSVHQMCAHSHELVQLAGGKPIGVYSEQGIEAWNKMIRAYKSGPAARARQMNVSINIYDIFIRMFLVSHPTMFNKKETCIL